MTYRLDVLPVWGYRKQVGRIGGQDLFHRVAARVRPEVVHKGEALAACLVLFCAMHLEFEGLAVVHEQARLPLLFRESRHLACLLLEKGLGVLACLFLFGRLRLAVGLVRVLLAPAVRRALGEPAPAVGPKELGRQLAVLAEAVERRRGPVARHVLRPVLDARVLLFIVRRLGVAPLALAALGDGALAALLRGLVRALRVRLLGRLGRGLGVPVRALLRE